MHHSRLGVDDMIVIVAVKLNVEYEAVGEPNPHPGSGRAHWG
jgi:hypothetical protein